jgi:hypothetical protein
MAEVDVIEPGPDRAAGRAAAEKIVAYLVEKQQPDGQWHADAGVTDPTKEQPLFWRIDTTCNVIVGLMHHVWAQPAARRSAGIGAAIY